VPDQDERNEIDEIGLSSDLLFDTLYRKYFRRIYNYAYMRLLKREAAEDVTQEVFLAAFTAMDRFDPLRGSGEAWLSKIAVNLVTNYQKRAQNYREISVSEVPETAVEYSFDDEQSFKNPVNFRTARILQKLSTEERSILAFRYEMGLTHEEIARNANATAAAIRQRLHRLLEKCRRIDEALGKGIHGE